MMCLEPQQEKSAESKFCFLKLPCVFGYVVPFSAISKKQNRKGSPQSLIYPLKSKLTSFLIKQFFRFGKEHQTLMRSRLRRFCFVRYAHLRKTSTRAEKCLYCSHNNYIPHLLRMTEAVAARPARPTRRVGMLRDDQIGAQLYTVYNYILILPMQKFPKNSCSPLALFPIFGYTTF